MTQSTVDTSLADQVRWPDLNRPDLEQLHRQGRSDLALRGLVDHLRRSEQPALGYSRSYVQLVREQATTEQKQAAQVRWQAAENRELTLPFHTNTYEALGFETIALAGTPEQFRAMAQRVLEHRSDWARNRWGFGETAGVALLLGYLWPLPECEDECLVPLLGWLLEQAQAEWKLMGSISEAVLGTSGHNWYAHSYKGFFIAGLGWPMLGPLGRFRSLGLDYLERELMVLFEEDGWSREGASGYHEFAFSSLMHLAHLAELNGMPLSGPARQRLRTCADASWRLIAPDGAFPLFGDDSRPGGYQGFSISSRPGGHPCDLLRIRAAQFQLPHAKFVAQAISPDWQPPIGRMLPADGTDLMPAFAQLPSEPPPTLDTHLPRSGIYAMRSNWSPDADYMALMAGPFGHVVSSHKHADLFTFELYARGRRIVVDNGYGAEVPELRNSRMYRMWRISSAAHNTVTIDGQDHLPIQKEFRYAGQVTPLIDGWRTTARYAWFSGVHESYRHLKEEVTAVRRKVFYLRNRYWIVIDRFTPATAAEHEYQLHFHLNVPAQLQDDGRLVTSGSGGNLLIVPVAGADGAGQHEPCPYPIKGFENPSHLWYTRRSAGRDVMITLLVPFNDDHLPAVQVKQLPVECDGRTLRAEEATGLEIIFDGERHVYFDQHMHWNLPWQVAGYAGAGRLFHSACMAHAASSA